MPLSVEPAVVAAGAEFALVVQAYEVLSDERRRDLYDAFGADALRLIEWIHGVVGSDALKPALPPVLLLCLVACFGAAVVLSILKRHMTVKVVTAG